MEEDETPSHDTADYHGSIKCERNEDFLVQGTGMADGKQGDRMDNMDRALDAFIAAILVSEEYRCYAAMRDKVKLDPELKAQIDDYRKRNYEFQTSTDGDFENLDRFEKEYENFRENPLVMDFLAAELDFCRLMQRVNMRIVSRLQFE